MDSLKGLTSRSSGPASLSPPARCPRASSGRRPSFSPPAPPSTRTSSGSALSSPPSRPSSASPATATSFACAAAAALASVMQIEISAAVAARLPVLGASDRGPSSAAARMTSSSVVCRGTLCCEAKASRANRSRSRKKCVRFGPCSLPYFYFLNLE